jgi:glycosyltransferase involved in cell wall biosynthesis
MHVLILHQATVFGGAERTTSNLLTYLDRNIVQRITLAAPEALRPLLPPTFDQFIDTTRFFTRGWFGSPHELLTDARACAHLLAEAKPDVVLGIMHYAATLAVLGQRLGRLPIKTIGSYRGPVYEHMRRYERGWGRWMFLLGVVGLTARLADRMIVPSKGTAHELRRRFFGPAQRIQVVLNGIDSDCVQRLAAEPVLGLEQLPRDLPRLCVTARLSPEKDFDLLLEAFRLLQSLCPAVLAVVGDGPLRQRLERQITDWGLADRVAFVGHRENVYPYMRWADVYLHTCQFEGFGYTMLEAMACGTPVIATDCPYGPREVLGDGEFGQLVPPQDVRAFAHSLADLLADRSRQQALSTLGLVRARQLSIERMARGYESVFQSLVSHLH